MTATNFPATGEQIVAHFRTYDHHALWAENWFQGPGKPLQDPDVPGTTTTIQGVLCCIDRDNTIAWLLMIVDDAEDEHGRCTVSWLCTTFSRLPTWKWAWVRADGSLHACREFVTWLELNDEMLPPS